MLTAPTTIPRFSASTRPVSLLRINHTPEMYKRHMRTVSRYRMREFLVDPAMWYRVSVSIDTDGEFDFDFNEPDPYIESGKSIRSPPDHCFTKQEAHQHLVAHMADGRVLSEHRDQMVDPSVTRGELSGPGHRRDAAPEPGRSAQLQLSSAPQHVGGCVWFRHGGD